MYIHTLFLPPSSNIQTPGNASMRYPGQEPNFDEAAAVGLEKTNAETKTFKVPIFPDPALLMGQNEGAELSRKKENYISWF